MHYKTTPPTLSLSAQQIARRKVISALFKTAVMTLAILAVIPLVLIFATLVKEGYKGMNSHYEIPSAMDTDEGEFFFWVDENYHGPIPTAWMEDTLIVTNTSGTFTRALAPYFSHTDTLQPLTLSVNLLQATNLCTSDTLTLVGDTLNYAYTKGSEDKLLFEATATDTHGIQSSDTFALTLYQGPYAVDSLTPLHLTRNGTADTLNLAKLFQHTSPQEHLSFMAEVTPKDIVSLTLRDSLLIVTPQEDTTGVVEITVTAEDQNFRQASLTTYGALNGTPFFHISNFLTALPQPEGELGGGIVNALVGSCILILIAVILALPTGVLGGFYLAEHPTTKRGEALRLAMEILQGVPSIVIGIIVNYVLVMKLRPFGSSFSALAGGVALAIMMLPVLVRTTEETLKMLPGSLKEASLALGAPYYHTVLTVLLPAGINGIVTGLLISVARIAGETAPLLFTSFGNDLMNYHPLKPIAALPLYIYRYAMSAFPVNQQMAWGASAVLIIFILGLNFFARFIAAHFDMNS